MAHVDRVAVVNELNKLATLIKNFSEHQLRETGQVAASPTSVSREKQTEPAAQESEAKPAAPQASK